MEVSCQLRRLNLEMDLGGVPRDQNTQADALTNSIFDDFEESRRIVADFEEVELIVLRESTEEAGKLDEEIKAFKSSKRSEAREDGAREKSQEEERRDEMEGSLVRTEKVLVLRCLKLCWEFGVLV